MLDRTLFYAGGRTFLGDIYYYALLTWISPIVHCKHNLSKKELIVF